MFACWPAKAIIILMAWGQLPPTIVGLEQNGGQVEDNSFKYIFLLKEKFSVLTEILLKFVPLSPKVSTGLRNGLSPVKNNFPIHIYGLVQERRNYIAYTLELHLSCTNPSIYASPGLGESTKLNSNKKTIEFGIIRPFCLSHFFISNNFNGLEYQVVSSFVNVGFALTKFII